MTFDLFEKKMRVAVYARVSTEHDAQLYALENQVDWYKPLLASRPNWEKTAQYVDEGITGTSAEKRPEFLRMIEDAKAKRFDMILTREVARFARNTVDALEYTRLLKEYGIGVYFINDNIYTMDGDGEFRLTIMATVAQDESRKTSIRVKSGQKTSMEKGVFFGNGNILGYDRVGKDLVINPEQAKTVRMIYDMYLSGMGMTSIAHELEKQGRLTSTGKKKWHTAYISHMLKNTFYYGVITYHKEYVPDYLKQKKIKNDGSIELLQIKGNHEPIITKEEFERVQHILEGRKVTIKVNNTDKVIGKKDYKSTWGDLLVCRCGNKFNRHHANKTDRQSAVSYQCYTVTNRGSAVERINRGLEPECNAPFIPEWKLDFMAYKIFSEYIHQTDKILSAAFMMLQNHIADDSNENKIAKLISQKQEEIGKLEQSRINLIEMRIEGTIDKDYFRDKKEKIEAKIDKLESDIKALVPTESSKAETDYTEKLNNLRNLLMDFTNFKGPIIPESVVGAYISKILVDGNEFNWYLRLGNETEVKNDNPVLVASFTLNHDDAKKYVYSISTKRRVYNWENIKVNLWA